jgi:enoyl-[acyl-carrier protein] reductase I
MIPIDLSQKVALIAGVQNEHSLAWAIGKKLLAAGARCVFSYQGERNKPALEKLTQGHEVMLAQCDVTSDAELDVLFEQIAAQLGHLDIVVHGIAFAPRQAMENRFVDTGREDWATAMDVSAYSLVALVQRALPIMRDGGSVVSLTYYASQKVVQKYNVMGVAKAALEATTRYLAADLGSRSIRVNTISAGPMRTVAARAIPGFGQMYERAAKTAAMGRNASHDEVGNMALFLLSDLAGGTTGETVYVDAGYSIMGMPQD